MAGWFFSEIGISANKDDISLKRQLMKCIGLNKMRNGNKPNYDDERCYACGYDMYITYDKDDMIFGEYVQTGMENFIKKYEMDCIFSIFNVIFPSTYIHILNSTGSTVCGDQYNEHFLLDPIEMKLDRYGHGEGECYGLPGYCHRYYHILDDDMYLSPEEFEEYESQHEECFAIYEWDGEKTTSYKYLNPIKYKSCIQNVIDESVKNGFTELTALILDKYKDILS